MALDEKTLTDFLRFKTLQGFKKYQLPMDQEYLDRIEYELGIITQVKYQTYFLIVADLCQFMRRNGIFFIVRGSGCGSCVVWGLGISNRWLDPIKLGLPFERFLNPERVSMPDLDIDIQDDRRSEVVEYTIQKYGVANVAKIVTFGTLGAKQCIHDIARALQIPNYGEVAGRIANAIPAGKGDDGKNIRLSDQLKTNLFLIEQRKLYPELFEMALRVEGKVRQAGVHAAGTIISPEPMTHYMPLYYTEDPASREPEDNFPVTMWDMYDAENRKLLKMDYLGLKTLSVIGKTVRAINWLRKQKGESAFDIEYIPQDDEKTWQLLSAGKTACVFQIEKAFVRDYARRSDLMRKDPWSLAVLVAIIRPGMMDSGNTEAYLRRASGQEEPKPPHPLLAETFQRTYGLMCFQEDVMAACVDFAGFTRGEADVVRKGVGKKNPAFIAKQQPKFFEGGMQPRIEVIFEKPVKFNGAMVTKMVTKPRNPELKAAVKKSQYVEIKPDGTLGSAIMGPGAENIENRIVSCKVLMQGATKAECEHVWTLIEAHSRYSFNNAHAAAYGVVVAYWTAYLKANYPLLFMNFMINSEAGTSSKEDGYNVKVAEYVEEARSMGIRVLPPCVTKSHIECRADPAENAIRFGLGLIKKVSTGGSKWIIEHCQDAVSFKDFILRCFEVTKDEKGKPKVFARVNKTDFEQLINAGAMDKVFGMERPKLLAMLPQVCELASSFLEQTAKVAAGRRVIKKPEDVAELLRAYQIDDDAVEEKTAEDLLESEREATGCFLTTDCFAPYRDTIRQNTNTTPAAMLEGDVPSGQICFAGMMTKLSVTVCKSGRSQGQEMAFMDFVGTDGVIEGAVCFPKSLSDIRLAMKNSDTALERKKIYLVFAHPSDRDGGWIVDAMGRLSGFAKS